MIRLLFQSSRQKGRLALDSVDGHTLSSGQRIALKQGETYIPGIVESDGETYAFLPDGTSWIARIPLRAGLIIEDYTTLEANYPERETEQPMAINQNSNDAMAALYGPSAAHSEYSRFTKVKYREDGRTKQGLIIWITEATKDAPMFYIIEGGGFPDFVPGGDITGVVE